MPVTARQIAAKIATVSMPFDGDTITIDYYPNKLTDKMVAQIQAGLSSDNDMLAELIKSWDVYEDDEHTVMFPLTRINEFGIPFKQQVAFAIAGDINPEAVAPHLNGRG